MSEHSPPFSVQEIDIVRQIDLSELLTHLGYEVKPKGSYHTITSMPHIMIKRRTGYYDNYEKVWGDAITFLKAHHGMSFKEAVTYLLAHNGRSRDQPLPAKPPVPLNNSNERITPSIPLSLSRSYSFQGNRLYHCNEYPPDLLCGFLPGRRVCSLLSTPLLQGRRQRQQTGADF